MPRIVDDDMVEPVAAALLGLIDTGDRGTDEQRSVLGAIVAGSWDRPDLELAALAPLTPAATADAITDPAVRARVRELMVLLAECRHPLTDAQVGRLDAYAAALGETGPGLQVTRELVRSGAELARADMYRFIGDLTTVSAEPSLAARYAETLAAPDPELAGCLRALHDLPAGTLGHAYVEFYRRNGITLPGDDPTTPATFVAHDFTHVIGGYEPTGPGEIALGAMLLAIDDTEHHWIGCLANLGVHEAGYLGRGDLVPKTASLSRPGAAELVADAFRRGAQCTGDFSLVDHFALVELPLDEVRARFGVLPLTL